jgi:hypothetical protein
MLLSDGKQFKAQVLRDQPLVAMRGGLSALEAAFGFPFLLLCVHAVGPKRSTRMRSTGTPMLVAASVAASAKGDEPQM